MSLASSVRSLRALSRVGGRTALQTRMPVPAVLAARPLSDTAVLEDHDYDDTAPTGSLFAIDRPNLGLGLVGATAAADRTFGPRDNAACLLATGGVDLAAHASFDPNYDRAQGWIRQHAVGPAVLSPILIGGLTGALVEAAFPHGVVTAQSMQYTRPLIVGVPVTSQIKVISVQEEEAATTRQPSVVDQKYDKESVQGSVKRKNGYNVVLQTQVTRVRDGAVIASGTQELWVADYYEM